MSVTADHRDADPPITILMKDIVADLGTLLQKQVELARIEMRDELAAAKTGMGAVLFGGFVLAAGVVVAAIAAAQGVGSQLGWSAWEETAAASGILVLLGVVLLAFAFFRLRSHPMYPKRAARELQEDLQWLTKSPS